MSASKVEARNRQIVAARAQGMTWSSIAADHGLSDRQARTIWTENRSRSADNVGEDAMASLDHYLARLDDAIERLALIIATGKVYEQLAAIRLQMGLEERKLSVMQAVGLVPNLSLWGSEYGVKMLTRLTDDLFEEFGGDPDRGDAVVARVAEARCVRQDRR